MTIHSPHPVPMAELNVLLANYAAGSLTPALHALVGAHLELSNVNRKYVQTLEESLARQITALPVCAVQESVHGRERRLADIFAQDANSPKPRHFIDAQDNADPKALHHFFGQKIDDLAYKTLLPGVREYRVDAGQQSRAILYRIRAGQKLPEHTHDGTEITLVIRGSFYDDGGHFKRGDIVIADEDINHVPIAGDEGECVCFSVIDAPLRLTGSLGRFINPFLTH